MEQLILTTLLKYNDIFDAFQKLFELHNYNCADQRVKISQYLKQPQSECIYITLNKSSDIIPFQEEFEKQEKKIKSILLDDRVALERYFQTNIESQMIQLKAELCEEHERYQSEIVNLKNFIHEMYQTKTDQRQQRSNLEERLLKMNEQMEYLQSKYALKTYTEQNIIEIKNSISNISQSINFLRQDTQTLHKQTKENKLIQQTHNDQFSESIQSIQSDLQLLDKFQYEIQTMRTDLNCMSEENEKMYDKFKSIAQLFQELDANNTNTVKFQIHAAIKIVNEDIMALKYRQQSFQDQIVVYKENMDKHLQSAGVFQNNCIQQFDRFENEQEYNTKQFKIISKMLEQYKQLQQSASQNDVLPRILQLQTNQTKFQSYCNSLFYQIKKTIDVIQDFCETSQLTTPTSEQDLTNLILLMDRRIMEFSKCFREPTNSKMPSIKLQTPRLSTSIESPFRIHSKQKQSSQKPINQTISFDSKRDSLL